MVFKNEKREARKYKARKSIHELGEELAELMFPTSDNTIDDVIETLITSKAIEFQIFPEEERKKLNRILNMVNAAKNSTPIAEPKRSSGLTLGNLTLPKKGEEWQQQAQ